ncbi:MAG: hypothetical protein A2Y79_08830 [Deltaproteobacteria bacterium RBG_13_43_22]|jgi:hypothetical protein|nr:MAG: hypothetical protein A2Y79_08830 [Deltaproteobacteria bacterium RBG_13_43_22]
MWREKIKLESDQLICSYGEGSKNEIEDGYSSIPLRDIEDELIIPEIPTYSDSCKYCNSSLKLFRIGSKSKGFITVTDKHLDLYCCINCGWWFLERLEEESHFTGNHFIVNNIEGAVKYYNVDSYDVPIVELRNYLKRHPNDIAYVNPYRFELLMQDCFKDYFGPSEVIHLGKSGDGGIDLKIVKNNKETILVQVKRRFDITKNEGPKVVRELNGVLFRDNIAKGIVVTTSISFTKAAMEETKVKTPTKKRYCMKLLAFDDVVSILNLPRLEPYAPWEKYLNELNLKKDKIRL